MWHTRVDHQTPVETTLLNHVQKGILLGLGHWRFFLWRTPGGSTVSKPERSSRHQSKAFWKKSPHSAAGSPFLR